MTVLLPGRFGSAAEPDVLSRKRVRRRRRRKAGEAQKCVAVLVAWGERWVPVVSLPVPAELGVHHPLTSSQHRLQLHHSVWLSGV